MNISSSFRDLETKSIFRLTELYNGRVELPLQVFEASLPKVGHGTDFVDSPLLVILSHSGHFPEAKDVALAC